MQKTASSTGTLLGALALLGIGVACAGRPPDASPLQEAETALALGQASLARDGFAEELERSPGSVVALRGLALAYLDLGEPHRALQAFHALEREAPEALDAELRLLRCRALELSVEEDLLAGRTNAAVRRAAGPASAACGEESRERLGRRALRAAAERAQAEGRDQDALDSYHLLLRRDPGDPEASLFATRRLLESGREAEALELLSDGLKYHPEDGRLIVLMLEMLGHPPETSPPR